MLGNGQEGRRQRRHAVDRTTPARMQTCRQRTPSARSQMTERPSSSARSRRLIQPTMRVRGFSFGAGIDPRCGIGVSLFWPHHRSCRGAFAETTERRARGVAARRRVAERMSPLCHPLFHWVLWVAQGEAAQSDPWRQGSETDSKVANTCEHADSQAFASVGRQRGGGTVHDTPATH